MSVRLYDVLDRVGASAEFRKLRQDCAISAEIINTVLFNHPTKSYSCYIFGSSSEGTTTEGLNSDSDFLYCSNKIVVDNIIKIRKRTFIVNDSWQTHSTWVCETAGCI